MPAGDQGRPARVEAAVHVDVEVVRVVTDELVAAIGRLLPQLSRHAEPPDAAALGRLIAWESNTLLVARTAAGIVGTLTLVVYPTATGTRAWIEDVVVDGAARGHGVGAALTREAIRLAGVAGAHTVDLTSRPERQAANRLYERLGFQLRQTRAYRLSATDLDT